MSSPSSSRKRRHCRIGFLPRAGKLCFLFILWFSFPASFSFLFLLHGFPFLPRKLFFSFLAAWFSFPANSSFLFLLPCLLCLWFSTLLFKNLHTLSLWLLPAGYYTFLHFFNFIVKSNFSSRAVFSLSLTHIAGKGYFLSHTHIARKRNFSLLNAFTFILL